MADLASLLYDRFSREILTWGPEITRDIYALSVYFDFSAGIGSHFSVHLSYNTNERYQESIRRASSPAEAKWNYAFWLQDDKVTVDTGPWVEDGEDLPADAEAYEEWNDAYFKAVVSACAAAARRLHEDGIILTVFGRSVPVIVHDLEYPDLVLRITREANPPGVADEFLDATANHWRWTGGTVTGTERHANCRSEYELATDQYEDRECFNFYDGTEIGTAVCRQCGQLFLIKRVDDGTIMGRVWLHFPTTAEAEADWKEERIDPYASADALEQFPHVRLWEPVIGGGNCREEWVYPPERSR